MNDKPKNITEEAIVDAKLIKEAAIENAKKKLIEDMSPEIKRYVESAIRNSLGEDQDRMRRAADGYGETEFEEGDQKMDYKDKDLENEALASMIPALSEMEDDEVEEAKSEDDMPELEEAKDKDEEEEEEDEGDLDEDLEISNEALSAMYDEALKAEAAVKKGFSDNYKTSGGDWAAAGAPNPSAGLADVKSGEKAWEEEEPSNKQDYQVKEGKDFVNMLKSGLAENKRLKKENTFLREAVKKLTSTIQEVNLFNSKVVHANKILGSHKLTNEQKKTVLENLDEAKSIDEVKKIHKTIVSTFNAVVNESKRKPSPNAQKSRKSGSPSLKSLNEAMDRSEKSDYSRMRRLAGLIK